MKKGLLFLFNNFEDCEALVTRAILKKNCLNVQTFTPNASLEVLSSQKLIVKADQHIDDVNFKEYDFLIIPGGPYILKMIEEKKDILFRLYEIIQYFFDNKKIIGAICAGPVFLGQLKLLKKHNFTCYPGCEKYIEGNHLNEKAVTSDFIITSRSPETVFHFVKHLLNKMN